MLSFHKRNVQLIADDFCGCQSVRVIEQTNGKYHRSHEVSLLNEFRKYLKWLNIYKYSDCTKQFMVFFKCMNVIIYQFVHMLNLWFAKS